MRNRKFLQSSDAPDGELPIYDIGNGNGHESINSSTTTATTTRQRHVRSKRNYNLFSSVSFVFGLVMVASLCIVTFHHYLGQPNKVRSSPRRFLANAAATTHTDSAPSNILYDIAILGAGPAGLTAAIFGARAGLSVVVLGSQAGLLSETPRLENFPGYHGDQQLVGTGEEWLTTTRSQARQLGAHFALPGLVASSLKVSSNPQSSLFTIPTQLDTFQAKSVIVATGATSRRLNLPHEQDLWGRYLHNCAICDGPMYKDKTVVVLGGGDAAIDAAIYLSRQTKRVILIHRKNTFDKVKAQSSLELVRQTPNIDIYTPNAVTEWKTEIINDDIVLTGVILQDQSNQETKYIACDGAFLMIGATPNTDWLSNTLLLDEYGLIRLDKHEENLAPAGMVTATSLAGVFAAGEVIDAQYKQAITAAAEGAQAALDAERWLRNQQPNTIDINKEDKRQAPVEVKKIVQQGIRQEKEKDPGDDRDDDCDLVRQECIDQIVHKYPVVVFSKPYCTYCRMALEALAIEGIPNPHIVNLSEHSNARVIQSTLASMTGGRRTVPNVFVGGTSIGGGDETVHLQSTGKLKPLLAQAGAIEMLQSQEQIQDKDAIDLGPPPNGDYGCDLGTEDCITKIVDQYPLVLFSLSWCPECHRMSELLATVGIHQPHIIDLDDYKKDGTNLEIRQSLVNKAKSNQVPSLFVGGEALGRYSSVLQLNQSGQLVPKLQAAGLI